MVALGIGSACGTDHPTIVDPNAGAAGMDASTTGGTAGGGAGGAGGNAGNVGTGATGGSTVTGGTGGTAGATPCVNGKCETGRVCCPSPLPCQYTCVPDCRPNNGADCPTGFTCDSISGVCTPPAGTGGTGGTGATGGTGGTGATGGTGDGGTLCGGKTCAVDEVCCPSPFLCADTCVKDCRLADGNPCLQNQICDQQFGICHPAGDGGPPPDGGPG